MIVASEGDSDIIYLMGFLWLRKIMEDDNMDYVFLKRKIKLLLFKEPPIFMRLIESLST